MKTEIKTYYYPKDDISEVCARPVLATKEREEAVAEIIAAIKEKGDEALFNYTEKFDKLCLTTETVEVSKAELREAYKAVSEKELAALKRAIFNVYEYHVAHKSVDKVYSKSGRKTGILIRPLAKAGIYVPGGTAAYPSSVLMTALPAKAAGVKEIVMCSPNPKNPLTLVAAHECGVNRIFKVGGAQAIASLAYGTGCIPKVDVIVGPGNIFVTLAKKAVSGDVKIDMLAGPSEILVIADGAARAKIVAADLLSQAEHDVMSSAILITNSVELAEKTKIEMLKQAKRLPRRAIIEKSLSDNGAVIIVDDLKKGCEIANSIAPEHLELSVEKPEELLPFITSAGAVFAGSNSPEPLGDYYAGPSHVLPTGGTARFSEVLNTDTFTRKMSYINYSRAALKDAAEDIYTLAMTEGFTAHAETVNKRFNLKKEDK